MADGHRRGVTRGYVWGLIIAVVITTVALLVAVWGALVFFTKTSPVSTPNIVIWFAPVGVLLAIALLVWGLWLQSLVLLRGSKTPPWAYTALLATGGYLLWCVEGLLAGLTIQETWLSAYSLSLGLLWGVGSLMCWAVLARRVYTDSSVPQWPWEKRGEPGPDWIGESPWDADPRKPDEGES